MKKHLLIATIALGAALAGNAKELKILYQDKAVENGATIKYEGYTVKAQTGDIKDGYVNGFAIITVDPDLHIVSDVDATVTVRAYSKNGEDIQLCAGGDCIRGKDLTKPQVSLKANDPLNLQMDAEWRFTNQAITFPFYDVLVEAWYNDDPSNKISVTVEMGDLSAGVESLPAAGNSVKVSGRQLEYDLTSAAELSVYSLSGKALVSKTVAGSGSISLANLPAGVYIYRVAGKNAKSGKFIIR